MDEARVSRGNFIFALIKLIMFIFIFCFVWELSKEFLKSARAAKDLKMDLLTFSMLSSFLFYTFFADLNEIYKKIQNFFFHSTFFNLLVPSLFIIMGLGYFLLPKIFNLDFDKDVFIFLGGFVLTAHLIFIARETKGNNFIDLSNYLFLFSILYAIDLMLFCLYLNIAFNIPIDRVIINGASNGALLIKSLFIKVT